MAIIWAITELESEITEKTNLFILNSWSKYYYYYYYFFFDLRGCPGQLARTTTNPTAHWTPCKPNEHIRHRGDDRRAHENSNPGTTGGDKPLLPPGQDPQCQVLLLLLLLVVAPMLGPRSFIACCSCFLGPRIFLSSCCWWLWKSLNFGCIISNQETNILFGFFEMLSCLGEYNYDAYNPIPFFTILTVFHALSWKL